MLGAITGDTIGSAYEFCNTKDYNFTLFLSESAYTDDSIMTMAVAQWLLADPRHTHRKLEEAMVEFAKDYPSPMGGYGTGFYRWLLGRTALLGIIDEVDLVVATWRIALPEDVLGSTGATVLVIDIEFAARA